VLAKEFGQRLRKFREERFLSQRAVGQGIGIETAQISRWERGLFLPNAETLVELARFLRVGIAKLLLGQEETPGDEPPIEDISLLERFRDLEKLSRKDREMVIGLIDAVIASRQYAEVTSRRARQSA
jgi:transcriptional regulator with XRE-family HTH domain